MTNNFPTTTGDTCRTCVHEATHPEEMPCNGCRYEVDEATERTTFSDYEEAK